MCLGVDTFEIPLFICKKAEIEGAGHESHSQPRALASRKLAGIKFAFSLMALFPILFLLLTRAKYHYRSKNNTKGMLTDVA